MWRARADDVPVPVTLHLDHCPDREWISICLRTGWNSVLFDGSELDVAENTRQTIEVVAEAERLRRQVEGEIESVLGVEDGVGSDEAGEVHPVEVSSEFIEATGIYSFAPAIGTAHGLYKAEPHLMPERVTEIVEQHPIPQVLHGGTGLTEAQFTDLIARGCAKVNISTALKIAFVDSHREYLEANPAKKDPPSMLTPRPRGGEGDGRAAHPHLRLGRPRVGDDVRGRLVPALIFDCDGVLADTERDGHRPAFNQAFAEAGLDVVWDEAEYARRLQIGGGKERIASLFDDAERARPTRSSPLHKRKTALYKEIVRRGKLPARPGIARIVDEALAAGWTLAVASTSAEESVRAVLEHAVGEANAARLRGLRRRHRARPRSPTRRSTCSRSSSSALAPERRDRDRGLAQRPARGRRRRTCAAWSP